MDSFSGVWPALVTPFDAEGHVNTGAARRLVDALLDAGVGGFYVNGTTGEGLLLSSAERRAMAATVVDQVRGRAPVMVHVGALSTNQAVELAAHAGEIGADAVAAIPPAFYDVGPEGMSDYYRAIAAASRLPVYIYYLPARTGVTVTVEVVRALMDIPQVRGIKFTASDLYLMERILNLEVNGRRLNALSGPDEMFLPFLATGVQGAIGTTINIMPRQFTALYAAFFAGDMARARAMQGRINQVLTVLLGTNNLLAAVKAVLRHQGIACGDPRRPVPPLSPEATERLLDALTAIGFFA